MFDATVAVVADDELRERARRRRAAPASSRARGGRQLSQEEKAARATHVVANDGIARGPRGRARASSYPELEAARDERRRAGERRGRRDRAIAGIVLVVGRRLRRRLVIGVARIDFGDTIAS